MNKSFLYLLLSSFAFIISCKSYSELDFNELDSKDFQIESSNIFIEIDEKYELDEDLLFQYMKETIFPDISSYVAKEYGINLIFERLENIDFDLFEKKNIQTQNGIKNDSYTLFLKSNDPQNFSMFFLVSYEQKYAQVNLQVYTNNEKGFAESNKQIIIKYDDVNLEINRE